MMMSRRDRAERKIVFVPVSIGFSCLRGFLDGGVMSEWIEVHSRDDIVFLGHAVVVVAVDVVVISGDARL